ncbi:hypothetical protein SDC9_83460 [bioreactor metagenome]|uniref:Uncharacterized protein n=1 Tax=bioreactor metagenome TaxID=1076179 RepID=A0A644Z7N6_9ZZZZ
MIMVLFSNGTEGVPALLEVLVGRFIPYVLAISVGDRPIVLFLLGSAPQSMSMLTSGMFRVITAYNKGVSPVCDPTLGFAPASSNITAMSIRLPAEAASRGVQP